MALIFPVPHGHSTGREIRYGAGLWIRAIWSFSQLPGAKESLTWVYMLGMKALSMPREKERRYAWTPFPTGIIQPGIWVRERI
jgi:hypothetical protein